MVSDKQVEQACVWRKRKAASGREGGSEALGSAGCWLQVQPLGSCIPGRECVLGVVQKDFFPKEFFLDASQKLPLEGRPQWQLVWLPSPPHQANQHPGFRFMVGGIVSESPTPRSVSSKMIVTDHEKDHSTSPHLQPPRKRGS